MLIQPKKPQLSKSTVRWNKMAPKPKAPKIYKNLIHAWHLDEDSGTRYDSIGSNHLSDTDATLSAVGKIGKCADFVYLSNDFLTASELNFGNTDFHITTWAYVKSTITDQFFIRDGDQNELGIGYVNIGTGKFAFILPPGYKEADSFGAVSLNTWYMLSCYYDSVADEMGISVNAGTVDTASQTAGEGTPSVATFYVGALGVPDIALDTRVDAIHVWDRVLTQDEVAYMYNGGVGRQLSPRS